MIFQANALIGGALPQKHGAQDVQQIFGEHQPPAAINIRIGEIDGQRRVVVAQIGTEQQRLHVIKLKLKAREITGVGMEQAIGATRRRADIAMTIDHHERVIVFQRATRPRRGGGHRNVERRFGGRFAAWGSLRERFRRHVASSAGCDGAVQ